MKRLFDLSFSIVLLLLLIVPMLLIAIAIRLTSKGPALYWSERVGRNNKIFGEEIIAVIVPLNDIDDIQLKKDIRLLCKAELSNYKVPSTVLVWKELPKTLSNKLLRRKVRELVNENY